MYCLMKKYNHPRLTIGFGYNGSSVYKHNFMFQLTKLLGNNHVFVAIEPSKKEDR